MMGVRGMTTKVKPRAQFVPRATRERGAELQQQATRLLRRDVDRQLSVRSIEPRAPTIMTAAFVLALERFQLKHRATFSIPNNGPALAQLIYATVCTHFEL
jgi:hypothetical protein